MRRKATIALHWLTLVLLILLVAGGPIPVVAWAFALSGLAMCLLAVALGVMNGPGPKLEGALRRAHPWLSRAMYAALGIVAALTAWSQLGGTWSGPSLPNLYFYLMSASALHAIFHLWRHTALGDEALRRMTPTSMHKLL
ncbi:hypothetical protein [uncultured Tateyamaria sp.]|uniref:hypothetical protein n=1 Tax=uncultured Tateyamaria sp. TaxID=455651 RepID=UPI0026138EFE|nr:hypothetical protein [uncultured Tateyamaria sp.]